MAVDVSHSYPGKLSSGRPVLPLRPPPNHHHKGSGVSNCKEEPAGDNVTSRCAAPPPDRDHRRLRGMETIFIRGGQTSSSHTYANGSALLKVIKAIRSFVASSKNTRQHI